MKFILIIIATALVTFIEADRPVFFLKCSDGEDNRARNVCNNQCYATNCLPRETEIVSIHLTKLVRVTREHF